jgi:hypothetical protein
MQVSDLPDFAQDKTWRKTFLPTLYDKFFALHDPFSQFLKGSKAFLSLLQTMVEEVYPDVTYKVMASDTIHQLVVFCLVFVYINANNLSGDTGGISASDWPRPP